MYTRRPNRPDGQFYRNQRRLRLTRDRRTGPSGGRSPWSRAAAVFLIIALAYAVYGFLGHHQPWVKIVGIGAAIAFAVCLVLGTLRR
jgi:hypothetical protein